MAQRADRRAWILEHYEGLRASGQSPREAWQATKQAFTSKYKQGDVEQDVEQAWKVISGAALEKLVLREFERQISKNSALSEQLEAKQWRSIKKDEGRYNLVIQILSETLWLRGELQEPYTAESQVDFVAMETRKGTPIRVVATYSCKASLRERFQQDLYWAERFRSRGIRFCFITIDKDGHLLDAASKGNLQIKEAKMAAALYDRIYLFTDEPIKHFTRIFRPIDQLAEDLQVWLQAG